MQIDSAGMITPAEVNEEQHCFIGRSIAIRYKGEEHVSSSRFFLFSLPTNKLLGTE